MNDVAVQKGVSIECVWKELEYLQARSQQWDLYIAPQWVNWPRSEQSLATVCVT